MEVWPMDIKSNSPDFFYANFCIFYFSIRLFTHDKIHLLTQQKVMINSFQFHKIKQESHKTRGLNDMIRRLNLDGSNKRPILCSHFTNLVFP